MIQIVKNINRGFVNRDIYVPKTVEEAPVEKTNKKSKKKANMITPEQIEMLETTAANMSGNGVKFVKRDKGLIERTESSKIIITEDNRQVLVD